ncbi:MAG: di-heme oxidoredictase family protein [Planctomycetota bacterium]
MQNELRTSWLSKRGIGAVALTPLLLVACGDPSADGANAALVAGTPGSPAIDGTPAERDTAERGGFRSATMRLERGAELFSKKFKPSEGLGPYYNATSCESCHSAPVTGGSAKLYRNFYLINYGPPESQTPHPYLPSIVLPAFGGSGAHLLATFSTTNGRVHVPASIHGFPVNMEQRNGISALGVGLFEGVSDATIIALADPEDLDGDGISGRYNTEAGSIGRFGVKAQANNLEGFTRGPLQNQMGITTNPFDGPGAIVSLANSARYQAGANPNAPTRDNDGVPDPELSHQDLGDLIFFTRNLPPPQKTLPFSAAATQGELLFDQIGCTKCHIPSLPSSLGVTEAYTDLLIHDMGDDLAGVVNMGVPQQTPSSPSYNAHEWRTAPLWGVSKTAPFLHDGRAETIEEAILLHAGEGLSIRQAFEALDQADRDAIIEFLEHL